MLILRPIQKRDAAAVARIHALSWRDAYRGILRDAFLDGQVLDERFAHWRGILDHPTPEQVGFLALEEDGALGFIWGEGRADPRWGTLLDNLHVLPGHRGERIGTRLMHALAEEALGRWPEDPVHLWCFEANRRSLAYYRRHGGRPVERRPIPDPEGAMVMAWRYAWDGPRALLDLTAGPE
ncbi:MAG: GNAT family N-acetyltransferase [Holophaga sp.]|jgi:GNAT superfamily N-acetyltransferase